MTETTKPTELEAGFSGGAPLLGAPPTAGTYVMYCAEADYEPTQVQVFERSGLLMVNDPHLGIVCLADYHAGLTEIRWEQLPPNDSLSRVHAASETGNENKGPAA